MRETILRDHLVAALRDAVVPISTLDLAKLMPGYTVLHRPRTLGVPLCVADHSPIRRLPYAQLVECRGPGEHVLAMSTTPLEIAPLLEQLRGEGRCQQLGRARVGPGVLWSWVPPAWAPSRRAEVELEEQFAAIVTALAGWGWA